MSKYNYTSHFRNEIINFLEYKKYILKQKLHPINLYLYDFDKYCAKNKITLLTKENIEDWLILKENENKNTLRLRAYTIKSFSKYLNMKGFDAYIINSKYYQCKTTYIPHIFSDEEILEFFKKLDEYLKTCIYHDNYKVTQYKLFFKILYCTGMRNSELLNLKFEDIDFENKTIIIKKSKNDITRLLYLNNDLNNDLKIYYDKYCNNNISNYIFSNKNNKISISNIRKIFHRVIDNCNFNKSDRYRIHDLRHTFAVKNLNIAFKENIDTYIILPTLKTYMGHSSIASTEYYLRFISDIYPEVIEKIEENFKGVIPKIGEQQYEE